MWGKYRDKLLESSVDSITRSLGLHAGSLLSFTADLAIEARIGEEFDSDRFSSFSFCQCSVSNRDDVTGSLMSTD